MSSSPPADHSSAQSPSCPFPAELLRLFGGANCFFQAANAAIKGTDGQEHQQDEADQQQEPNGSLLLSKFPSEESASTSLRGSPNEEEAEGEAVHDENSLFETIAKLAGIEPGLKEETEERRTGEEYAAEESGEVAELGNGSERADSGGELAEENNGAPKGVCPLRGLLGTLTPSSSSSRRKSCMPTRIKEESEEDGQDGVVSTALADVKGEAATNGDEELRNAIGDSPVLPNGQLAGPQHPPANPFAHFPSTAVLFPQFFQANSAHLQQQQQFARMAQSFRDEMLGMGNGTSADDKHQVATGDFSPNNGETQQQLVPTQQAHAARLLSALVSMQQQQMEQMGRMASAPGGGVAPSLFGGRIPQPPFQCPLPQFGNNPAFFAAFQQHPLIAAAMAAMAAASNNGGSNNGGAGAAPVQSSGGGIFPPQHQLQPGTWPQTCHPPRTARCPMGFTSSSLRLREPPTHLSSAEDGSPRKKRAKVTDSVRGPRSSLHRELALANSSYSERSSPSQQQYPPTMVAAANAALAAQNSHLFALRHRSPHRSPAAVSGQEERAASCNNLMDRRPTLTHVHLKKAKLMFFYQRYPSSTLLKSYFPDVYFNKHNTAQLVKWFSNFREFFYMQMEKYAKQALGDGMRDPNEIFVSTDSEVFKQLQQHYNKNSAFQPPESLLTVVEQTLREFFVALQQGRDSEPSWKKQIYKVIQQLDEPIPEYFREPQFVELLEQS